MKSTLKTLVSAVAGLGFLTSMATDASACGGRGGGGWGGGFRHNNYNYQSNYYPQYQQYPQQYPQQQLPPQQFPQQQVQQQQYQQVPQQQVQQFQQPQGQQLPQQQFQQGQQQQVQQAPQQQQFSQQGVPQGQTVQGQQVVQGQGAPVARNAVAAPQTRVVAKPVSTGGVNVVSNNAPAAVPQGVPAQPTQGSAEMSALQALSGWDGSEPAADAQATAQATFNPVGEFVATLANGATVRLSMMDDSTFTWVATNKGKNSSFQGSYTIEGGSLKLLRSNDSQKLEGSFGQSATGFNFKLGSGQSETSMSFVRS
jgi:hypothetical protein